MTTPYIGNSSRRRSPTRTRYGLFGAALIGVGCLPPSLRSAHSLDKGDVAFETGLHLDAAPSQASILTVDGDANLELQQGAAEIGVVFGLGKGFELGAHGNILLNSGAGSLFGLSPIFKYSFLDERRMTTPLSMAIGADRGSGGILTSSNIQIGGGFAVRPIANVWFGRRTYSVGTPVDDRFAAPETDESTGGQLMGAELNYIGFDIPVGFEFPIRIGDDRAIVPVVSYTVGIPIKHEVVSMTCSNCLFGLESFNPSTPMSLFVGLRFQPWLKEGPQSEAGPQGSPVDSSPQTTEPDSQHRFWWRN